MSSFLVGHTVEVQLDVEPFFAPNVYLLIDLACGVTLCLD